MSQKTEWVMAALQDGGMFTVATLMDATNLTEAQVIAELQALEAADLARVTRLDDRADRWRWCGEPQQKQERKPAPVAAVTTEAATAAPVAASRPLNQRILLLLETQPNINSRTVAQQLGVEIKPVRASVVPDAPVLGPVFRRRAAPQCTFSDFFDLIMYDTTHVNIQCY